MLEYCFDISYAYENTDLNSEINSIVKNYKDVKWYASDCGTRGLDNKTTYNNGFTCKSIESLKAISELVVNSKVLYIDFINKDENSEDVADTDSIDSDSSDNSLDKSEVNGLGSDVLSNNESDFTDSDISEEQEQEQDKGSDSDFDDNIQIYVSRFRLAELSDKYKSKYESYKGNLVNLEKELNDYLTNNNNDR